MVLNPQARRIIERHPLGKSPFVFPSPRHPERPHDPHLPLRSRVRTEAGIKDVRIHDLRHRFASRALALGESLPMIGKLLDHTQLQTTATYAHLGRHSLKFTAVRIFDSLEADMDTPPNVSADQ